MGEHKHFKINLSKKTILQFEVGGHIYYSSLNLRDRVIFVMLYPRLVLILVGVSRKKIKTETKRAIHGMHRKASV